MDEVEYLLHNFYLFILCQRLSSLRLASLTAKVRHSSILVKSLTFGNNTALVVILTERSDEGSRAGTWQETFARYFTTFSMTETL